MWVADMRIVYAFVSDFALADEPWGYTGRMQRIVAFVLADVPGGARSKRVGERVAAAKGLRSVPHYYDASVPRQFLIEHVGDAVVKAYPPHVILVEMTKEVADVFSKEAFELREQMIDECQRIARSYQGSEVLSEEYAIAVVDGYTGDPEQFFNRSSQLASFLKSERMELDEQEIAHTLQSQMKYGKDDIVIVDWDGAVVFEPSGNVEPIVELFQVANLQLLQYRVLHDDLDYRLRKVETLLREPAPKFGFSSLWNREVSKAFKQVISVRANSIADFDALEREIKLIGDWYSARLFELIATKFRLADWKRSVRDKLDAIEDVYGIVSQNFAVDKQHYLELLQILLFFVLQVGWFVLIILELYYFTSQLHS
jgi:hypothetical protein